MVLPGDEMEQRLMNGLTHEMLRTDEIRVQSDLPLELVTVALVLMQLKNPVWPVGGNKYMAVREEYAENRI